MDQCDFNTMPPAYIPIHVSFVPPYYFYVCFLSDSVLLIIQESTVFNWEDTFENRGIYRNEGVHFFSDRVRPQFVLV